jgi:hypothetical protein
MTATLINSERSHNSLASFPHTPSAELWKRETIEKCQKVFIPGEHFHFFS